MKDKIKKILEIYQNDENCFEGYSAIKRLHYSAPEDYIESRTEWNTLKDYADDMYYMLSEIFNIVKEIDEEL
jgi:hypothetical protein